MKNKDLGPTFDDVSDEELAADYRMVLVSKFQIRRELERRGYEIGSIYSDGTVEINRIEKNAL